MNIQEFKAFIKENPVFLDGATGSNLLKRGMPAGVCPEKWIIEHKEVLLQLQREYVEAGSSILYAPTFSANRIKLKEYGLDGQMRRMNHELAAVCKEAAGQNAYVAGDITMTGEQLAPVGKMDFEELITIYKEQIGYLAEAGVDLLVVETMMSLQETRAALIAAKEVCELPVIATMTFEADGRTLYGTDAKTAAVVLESLGAAAVGANCSTGPDKMISIIRDMAEVTTIPIIAKPNAGLPFLDENGQTAYDMDETEFAQGIKLLVEAGASIIGGCCGTTPAYIKAAKDAVCGMQIPRKEHKKSEAGAFRYLTSERKTAAFSLNDNFMMIGERINPTGKTAVKKKLQTQLKDGCMEMIAELAEEQEACGASILDVNVGMSGIDEKEMMLRAIETIGQVSSLPLSIDSSHVDVIEAALRRYPGRALINSISYEKAKIDALLPIAKKYGAMFILLPLSDKGLPESLAEKIEIIEAVQKRAYELGMRKEDIIVDGLVATVGANKSAAIETLETIRYCREKELATICGLSNISFGLPERSYVNTAFLTMAIREGLTMAIANPSQELLVSIAFASDLLLDKKDADIRYIQLMDAVKEKREKEGETAPKSMRISTGIRLTNKVNEAPETVSAADKLRADVLKGNRNGIVEDTKKALQEGSEPKKLLDDVLLAAINEVGELFDKGKYFLPQLIASAEAMKASIEYLEPLLMQKQSEEKMPAVVIATVEGDIHDIGKNLVALMLKNYGFQVIDLGKDVPKEKIIEEAVKHNAQVIALSALMTTTMQQMKQVISYAKEKEVSAKIIIGGAVITQEYADEIGADGYSRDAADAVKLIKQILNIK